MDPLVALRHEWRGWQPDVFDHRWHLQNRQV